MDASSSGGRFGRLFAGLARTRDRLADGLRSLAGRGVRLDEATLEEMEEILLGADCGMAATQAIVDGLRSRAREAREGDVMDLIQAEILQAFVHRPALPRGRPHVVIAVGVNGSGKTTTVGKLAARSQAAGRTVILAAADTYRAAAVEQLQLWGERIGVPVVAQQSGADPAAVAVDALKAALARGADEVLVDTAGRLHTHAPLMRELEKIGRVAGRHVEGAPHEVLLVMDAGTGQNGLEQARRFSQALPVTGLVLTKLDGTARGGVALAVSRELDLPIRFIGVGEQVEDLLEFQPEEFVRGLTARAPA